MEVICYCLLFGATLLFCMNLHLLFSSPEIHYLLVFYKFLLFVLNLQSFLHFLVLKLTVDKFFELPRQSLEHLQMLEHKSRMIKVYSASIIVKIFEDCKGD